MFRLPEKSAWLLFVLLAACSHENHSSNLPPTASAVIVQPTAASSAIAAAVLQQNASAENILSARKDAKANVNASDVVAAMLPETENAASDVSLPQMCERYYRRVDACFAQQGEDALALQRMNADARLDAAVDSLSDADCEKLNRSFDAVASNLNCESR